MHIREIEVWLFKIPLSVAATATLDAMRGHISALSVLWLEVKTDSNQVGYGLATHLGKGTSSLLALANEVAPLLKGVDPWQAGRLLARIPFQFPLWSTDGPLQQVLHALDCAVWDLKGKEVGKPVYQLLGQVRDSIPTFLGDHGWAWRSGDEILESTGPWLDSGMGGISVEIGNQDPEVDAERLTRVRDKLGEDVWLGVTAGAKYDHALALHLGRFLDEDIAPEWYEDPIPFEDLAGYDRLARRLETPIASGRAIQRPGQVRPILAREAIDVFRFDPQRLGGIDSTMDALACVWGANRTAVLCCPSQIGIQIACSHPGIRMLEHGTWLDPILDQTMEMRKGMVTPSSLPGLGLVPKKNDFSRFSIG